MGGFPVTHNKDSSNKGTKLKAKENETEKPTTFTGVTLQAREEEERGQLFREMNPHRPLWFLSWCPRQGMPRSVPPPPSLWKERGSSAEMGVGGRASAPPQHEEERWHEVVSPFKTPQGTQFAWRVSLTRGEGGKVDFC